MKVTRWIGVGVAGIVVATGAWATEGGGGAYPNGAEDFMTGAVPPPGDYLITYGLYYTADDLKDGRGNDVPINFDLEVAGAVFRYIHVTPIEIAGGSWAQHIFVPLLNVDVTTPGGSDSQFGLGDLIVDPFILAWHKPPFHCAAGVDVYVPVGAYDENDLANVGRNYWTFEPAFALTYLNEKGVELSAKLMYDINLENDDTSYDSGDEFHADFLAGMALGKWKLGVNGFVYQQVTDDDAPDGAAISDEGSQLALGPAVSYQWNKVNITAKYQREFETESRPEGDRFWLKVICAF